MARFSLVFSTAAILAVTGCVSLPTGPSAMVLPGTGLSFEQFRNDDMICQQFASSQVGGTTANQAAMNSGVTSAAVGTALGAAAGAAFGGGQGAAIGAGSGLLAGSLVGTGAASSSMYGVQQRYDTAYIQCMYAKGHQVPVSGQFSYQPSRRALPPASQIPPQPPGSPPPAPQN
ncbi:MAG: glycine zipper family protein [Methylobacter sp.]